jgi:hypothetical protein
MNKEGIIVEAKKTLDKYVGLDNTQEVLEKIKSDLNDVLNNYFDENESYQKDFPLEFENEMGKWRIKSNGETEFEPKYFEYIGVKIEIKPDCETHE